MWHHACPGQRERWSRASIKLPFINHLQFHAETVIVNMFKLHCIVLRGKTAAISHTYSNVEHVDMVFLHHKHLSSPAIVSITWPHLNVLFEFGISIWNNQYFHLQQYSQKLMLHPLYRSGFLQRTCLYQASSIKLQKLS